ncbi:hypothetical protein H6P81_010543 [Aristolochia fimbriata]|uniref:Uncharacterized protein n=1 Tax=Aristolochia fimbriata TaxID=158543 RepID=A0AAV7EP24_ARIFI|nr:hypothetical protein H6P81_010543 [Aristolochia fimbriata]
MEEGVKVGVTTEGRVYRRGGVTTEGGCHRGVTTGRVADERGYPEGGACHRGRVSDEEGCRRGRVADKGGLPLRERVAEGGGSRQGGLPMRGGLRRRGRVPWEGEGYQQGKGYRLKGRTREGYQKERGPQGRVEVTDEGGLRQGGFLGGRVADKGGSGRSAADPDLADLFFFFVARRYPCRRASVIHALIRCRYLGDRCVRARHSSSASIRSGSCVAASGDPVR